MPADTPNAYREAQRLAGEAISNVLRGEVLDLWSGKKTKKLSVRDSAFARRFIDEVRALMLAHFKRAGVHACRYCGCTETTACATWGGGCSWVASDVCSAAPCLRAWNAAKKSKKGARRNGNR